MLRANITLSGESRSEERVIFSIQAVTGWREPACDQERDFTSRETAAESAIIDHKVEICCELQ